MMMALPDDIDSGIRSLVEYLNHCGFITFASCQGGEGHSFNLPTVLVAVEWIVTSSVSIDCMNETERRLAKALIDGGYAGFSIARVQFYQSSAEPWKPREHSYIQIEMWAPAG